MSVRQMPMRNQTNEESNGEERVVREIRHMKYMMEKMRLKDK